MIEKKKEIISEINDVIKDHDGIEILDFVGVDNLFDEENQIVELVEINYGMDKLIEDCGTTKVDAIVSLEKF